MIKVVTGYRDIQKMCGVLVLALCAFVIVMPITFAHDESDGPAMCTMQYDPVCGRKDTGIRCVTTPCPSSEIKTYGNACMLSVDHAEFLYTGECRPADLQSNTPTPKPTSVQDPNPPSPHTPVDQDPTLDPTENQYDVTQGEFEVEPISQKPKSWWGKITSFFSTIFFFWR